MPRTVRLVLLAICIGSVPRLAGAAEPLSSAASAPYVVSVRLLAPPGTDLSGLSDLLIQATGQPLSRQAVSRTVQLLDETGRFDNVLAYVKPLAGPISGGVELLLELIPRLRLGGFGFRGNQRFSEAELLKTSGLRVGDEYVPERARAASQAIGDAYRRAGYPSAQVAWEVLQGPTVAELDFGVAEGPPLRARRIDIVGQLGASRDRVDAALGLEPGTVVDLDRVDEGLARLGQLYRKARRYTAKVGPAAVDRVTGDLADLRVPIEAGPVFEFVFRGNRSFSERKLREVLEYDGEEALDDQVLARLVDKLTDFYRREGFLLSTISVSTRKVPGQIAEVFAIEEDRPYRVTNIALTGVETLDRAQLLQEFREAVRGNQGEPFFGTPESAEVDAVGPSGRPMVPAPPDFKADPDAYLIEAYAQATARLAERYREEGFWSVRVDAPQLDIDLRRHELSVRVDVHEGLRVRLEGLTFAGEVPLSQAEMVALSGLEVAKPLPRSGVDKSRKALLRGFAKQGLPFARVEVSQKLDPSGTQVQLEYAIHQGPKVRIGRILFRGNLHTNDGFLRQNLGLAPGQQYDPDVINHSQQQLQQLGVFDQVQIALLEPDVADPVKDLLVTLHERPPQSIVQGVGFSLIEGPRARIEYEDVNLLGRAIRFQTTLKINWFPASYLALSQPTGNLVLAGLPPAQTLTGKDNFFGFGGRLDTVLTDPRLFRLGNTIDAVMRHEVLIEQVDRPYYAFSRAAYIPSLSLVFNRKLTVGLQDDIEYDRITTYWADLDQVFSRLSFADLTNLRFPNGQGFTNSLGPSIGYDGRDDPINPHRGFAAILKGNWVIGQFNPTGSGALQSLPGEATPPPNASGVLPINLISTSGSLSGYIPIGPVVLALSLRGGRIFPIDSFVVPTQRFFLGGPDSNRGFPIDMMLPDDVRQGLHHDVALCGQSATGVSCSTAAQILRNGSNQLPSPGGEVFENLRAEVRFPLYAKLIDAAVFIDAGNLWADPARFDLFALRPAAGAGLRVPTPIGPVAFDLGFNLDPDTVVNESLYQFFLSIGLF